jgi:hypothetical protein
MKTSSDIATAIFDEWDQNYQYPMLWEVRVAALKKLIAIAITAAALRP